MTAAVDWLNKNQSFSIGLELATYDSGLDEQECAAVAQVVIYADQVNPHNDISSDNETIII